MYNTTAFLYDRTAAFEAPAQTCEDIHGLLENAGLHPPGQLGDLGSGTGLMSILFTEKGWNVYGVELSSAMLAVAEAKKAALPPSLQARLNWTEGDITQFALPPGHLLDAAVCLCNTINHLPERGQVENFARCAFLALKPGGVLILDSDTLSTFLGFFNHEPAVVWNDGTHRMTRTCAFDQESGRALHTALLEKAEDGDWHVIEQENMALQYHVETTLFEIFSAAGFRVESAEPYNPNPRLYQEEITPKVLWLLRKPDQA